MSPSGCCRWSRTPAGSSTPRCWCWRSGPGCGSTRCRSTGSTTPTAPCTSCGRPTDDLKGVWRVGRALATGGLPLDRLARPFGDDPRDRELPGVPGGLARQLVGFCAVGALSTLLYLGPVLPLPPRRGAAARQRGRAAGVGDRQHGRQPPADLRGAGPGPGGPPPGPGAGGLRHRTRPDQRFPRRARRRHRSSLARHRTRRAGGRQPRGDGAAVPALPRLGLSRPRAPRRADRARRRAPT